MYWDLDKPRMEKNSWGKRSLYLEIMWLSLLNLSGLELGNKLRRRRIILARYWDLDKPRMEKKKWR